MMLRLGPSILLCLVLSVPVRTQTDKPLLPPFSLTPQEAADIDRVLARWEDWNSNLQTFDCRFKRWTYDIVFGPAGQAKFVDLGVIKYASPSCLMCRVNATEKDGREIAVEDARAEHWTSDGTSIFEFNLGKKQWIEYKLPVDIAGRQLIDGPLAFGFAGCLIQKCLVGGPVWPCPFAATVKQIREDYNIRIIDSRNQNDEVRLEAFPCSQRVASMVNRVELIFAARAMSPVAMKIVQPNGKDYTVYQFFNIAINEPASRTTQALFRPLAPSGWQKVDEESPIAQANRPASDSCGSSLTSKPAIRVGIVRQIKTRRFFRRQ